MLEDLLGVELLFVIALIFVFSPYVYGFVLMIFEDIPKEYPKIHKFFCIYLGLYFLGMISMVIFPNFWQWFL